jgi:hypothetical protein
VWEEAVVICFLEYYLFACRNFGKPGEKKMKVIRFAAVTGTGPEKLSTTSRLQYQYSCFRP